MNDLAKLPLDGFLDRVAERAPSPGGGSVAAACAAAACALGRMVVAYSIPKETGPAHDHAEGIAERLCRCDEILRALITRDADAYTAMSAARPKRGAPQSEAYRQAVLDALAIPMEIAAATADLLTTLDAFKEAANRHLYSDLGATAVLAEAAVRAAELMVRVNVPELSDLTLRQRLLSDVGAITRRCAAASSSIASFVNAGMA